MNPEPTEMEYMRHDIDSLNQRLEDIEKTATMIKHFLYDDVMAAHEKAKASAFLNGAERMLEIVDEELSYVRDGSIDIETALDHIARYYAQLKEKEKDTDGKNV